MDGFNQITVLDLRMMVEEGKHIAYSKVIFERADYTGPMISADVSVSIQPNIPFDDLQNELIEKAMQSIRSIVEMPPADIVSAAAEGLKRDKDFGLTPLE